jgi:tRNA(Ile)-lysidine synthetase-like protein
MDYSLYDNVLEYIPENEKNVLNNKLNKELINVIEKFVKNKNQEAYIVSLSGGVDSMVLAYILRLLNKTVICIHINYNNREESGEEANFLVEWCKIYNITLIIHEITEFRRGDIKRSDYETKTKNIRFDLYNRVTEQYNCSGVLLGHHKDDIVENVFNNICRGRNILDLSVIKSENMIMGVKISRPMININKNIVLDFAHKYNIPYFKNTTPTWSLRGIFREQIFPLVNKTYSDNLSKNLLSISQESNEWNDLIEEKIIEPFMKKIVFEERKSTIDISEYLLSPLCFWSNVFMRIFYKYGHSIPSKKSIKIFMNIISSDKIKKLQNINISSNCTCKIINNILIIYFN